MLVFNFCIGCYLALLLCRYVPCSDNTPSDKEEEEENVRRENGEEEVQVRL